MKSTELFFKFPYKMYTKADWEKISKLKEEAETNKIEADYQEPPYSVGTEAVNIDEIIGYATCFSFPRSIDDVRENGADLTAVSLKNGKELSCMWTFDEFEKAYNEHVEKVQQMEMEILRKETEERSLLVKEILEKNLSEIKEKYKNEGIQLEGLD